jgi:hypothetical protein
MVVQTEGRACSGPPEIEGVADHDVVAVQDPGQEGSGREPVLGGHPVELGDHRVAAQP